MTHDFAKIEVASRGKLRAWLAAHHAQADSIWLITWKKGDPRHVAYAGIVEEALCFGWIDSLPRKLDAVRSMLLLSPRRIGSAWSKANKNRVERLIDAGLMTAAGLAKVEAAKRSGQWSKLDAVDNLIVPPDLAAALGSYPDAADNWQAFPPSTRRGILEWIANARRPETRARRIAATADKASRNERANQWQRPPTRVR
jgi:uncharacterized protein YdeI (YjbR/CyaY-like superfamily)